MGCCKREIWVREVHLGGSLIFDRSEAMGMKM
jgi:hypothetical protein